MPLSAADSPPALADHHQPRAAPRKTPPVQLAPSLHGEHAAAARVECCRDSHGSHRAPPEKPSRVPAEQAEQLVEPADGACHPGGHSAHAGDATSGATDPAAHGVHSALPAEANVPTGQASHGEEPFEAEPAAHGLQGKSPQRAFVLPAAHGAHA